MTIEEYYKLLEERWKRVNKKDLNAIKRYNEWKRELRKAVFSED